MDYLYFTQKDSLEHINQINYYEANEYMILDINTRSNLEIHETIMGREKKRILNMGIRQNFYSYGWKTIKKNG